MIEIDGLNKKFGKLQVLDNVSLKFNKGECVALIGPNGCGKTTLIKCLLGMVVPDSGRIFFDGKDVKHQHAYRERIGYMPQIGRYPENMSIERILNTVQSLRGYTGELDNDLMQHFNIKAISDKRMRTLSGGTTQKVSACLAFMFNPDVLILDEPTAGLDPLASEILKDKITEEKSKGKLILITSHLLSELDDLVTSIVFMQEGAIKFHLPVQELLQSTTENKLSKAIASVLRQENASQQSKSKQLQS
jgi:Cu-processing system ATP-binding protein